MPFASALLPDHLPSLRLSLVPTPLQLEPAILPSLLSDTRLPDLWCKRDDLTGLVTTGNKVRKLELLVAQAKAEGCDTLITCGGVQSNHCRATAAVAAQMGMRSLLFLRTDDPVKTLTGNLLLDRVLGADIRYISRAVYADRSRVMAAAQTELRAQGRTAYVIPEGGSNGLGCLGYLRCIDELRSQIPDPHEPLTVISAVGSGGTLAGLRLGVALADLPWRVVGVNVCDDRAYFQARVRDILQEAATIVGRPKALALAAQPETDTEICDGYVGRGYALSTPQELSLLISVARTSGLLLDPVYTGKAFFGMVSELRKNPGCFGSRIVFLHSGGLFGLLPLGDELLPVLATEQDTSAHD